MNYPKFVNCILIDRSSNDKQSHLPHVHEAELELFYVYAGEGEYMVDNRHYPIRAGDIVICNAGVLHGEEPSLVRQIHSYSVAITNVQFEGLPPNCLIDSNTRPVVSCGQLAGHVGQLMQLLYMLSADMAHLNELCSSLACLNCTPFVRQYDILDNKRGALLWQKGYQTNATHQNSRRW